MTNKIKAALAFAVSVAMMMTLFTAPSISVSAAPVDTVAPVEKSKMTLTIWGSQGDQAMLTKMAVRFKRLYRDHKYIIKLGICGEDSVKTTVINNLDTAGDVFSFTSDQTADLQMNGALFPITAYKANIINTSSPASVRAVTIGKTLYAYPYSADTYFLYYNKKMLSYKDVMSLDTIMSKKLGAGVVNFSMNMSSGWYGASFFLGAGSKLFGYSGRDATKCDFNSKNGVAAAAYMMKLTAKGSKFVDYGTNYDAAIIQNFKNKKLASAVSRTWSATKIQAALGKYYGAVKLPMFNLKGKATQMGSFATFKCFGVNSHSKHLKESMELAEFLTNEDNQEIRFKLTGAAPTNKFLADDKKALSARPAVAANAAQAQYSTLQPSIAQMSNFWTPMANFGTSIETRKTTNATLRSDLNKLVAAILAKLN